MPVECRRCCRKFESMLTWTHLKKCMNLTVKLYEEKFGRGSAFAKEFCEIRSKLSIEVANRPEMKKIRIETLKRPDVVEKRVETCRKPGIIDKIRKGQREWFSNLENYVSWKENHGKAVRSVEVRRRNSEGKRRWWSNLSEEEKVEQLKKCFRVPSKGEELINMIIVDIEQVQYTGDGKFWITFKDGTHANPDWVIRSFRASKKIIEFFGYTGYREETFDKIKKYEEIEIDCLAIFPEELFEPERLRNKILRFVA